MNNKATGARAMLFWALSVIFLIGSLISTWYHDLYLMSVSLIIAAMALTVGVLVWKEV